jgi:hypothetical protein
VYTAYQEAAPEQPQKKKAQKIPGQIPEQIRWQKIEAAIPAQFRWQTAIRALSQQRAQKIL